MLGRIVVDYKNGGCDLHFCGDAMKTLKMSEAPVRDRSKVACLDGLRGVLAMWVVIHHLLQYCGKTEVATPLFGVVSRGDHAVKLFMLLSGFVIAHLTMRTPDCYWRYLKRRFLRGDGEVRTNKQTTKQI